MTLFEHLELPKIDIELPKRTKGYGGSDKRTDRSSHGRQLLEQVSSILNRPPREYQPFGINPKLIFKIQLGDKYNLTDDQIISSGLNLLAKEPKSKQAIIVFSSDNELTEFKNRLESYSGLKQDHQYGYLDAIEALMPLEPQDRIGRLLELDPLEPGELVPLDLELWHTGNKKEMRNYLDNLNKFLTTYQEYPGMKVSDQYIGDYMCLARIKVQLEILEILLCEDAVKEIDRRPRPTFESPQKINIPLSELPKVDSPPSDTCGILVIDSGVQRGHPLIAPVLGDAEVFPDQKHQFITGGPDDADQRDGGHGTAVSGIAIYGDVIQSLNTRHFQPSGWLFSARVTNENNEYHPDYLLEQQIEKAIDYFVRNYPNCKVINISLGDRDLIYQEGQKQFKLAAKIDEIAYKLQHKNILFVISAGNFNYPDHAQDNELIRQDYPEYLLREEARIIEPATSAIALTVGSLSMGRGSSQYPDDPQRNIIAKVEGYPSPFSRTGFGVDGMIKPELVDFGGDIILDGKIKIPNELGNSVLTLAKNFQQGSLFRSVCGTSFSAPRVANLAAKLFTQFPNATSNLIRALIVNSAEHPLEIPRPFEGKDNQNNRLKIYGYGQAEWEKAAHSIENRVVLLEDNQTIQIGHFQIYEIPALPQNFLTAKGKGTISITLAFDPPTNPNRGDSYLGVTMEFHLYRNINLDDLSRAFQKLNSEDNTEKSLEKSLQSLQKKEIKLFPNVTLRKKGTIQKGQINISGKKWNYDHKSLYIVVICNRKWAKEDQISSQRYALLASISHESDQVDLYNHLRLQTRVTQRARIR